MALHSLYCADVPLRNCSLTHSSSGNRKSSVTDGRHLGAADNQWRRWTVLTFEPLTRLLTFECDFCVAYCV